MAELKYLNIALTAVLVGCIGWAVMRGMKAEVDGAKLDRMAAERDSLANEAAHWHALADSATARADRIAWEKDSAERVWAAMPAPVVEYVRRMKYAPLGSVIDTLNSE